VKSKERNLPATPQKSLSVSNAWKGSRKEKERFSENEIVEVGPGTKNGIAYAMGIGTKPFSFVFTVQKPKRFLPITRKASNRRA